MNVLYLGANSGTSRNRLDALARLGHQVTHRDPEDFLPRNRILQKLNWETGGIFLGNLFVEQVMAGVPEGPYNLCWVDGGRYVTTRLLRQLRHRVLGPILNYNVDDPYGARDRLSWLTYRRSVQEYDLVVVVREPNILEAEQLGAKRVLRVYRSADEIAHAPTHNPARRRETYESEVLFLGTWFPERGPLLQRLIELKVPLAIRGNRWERAPQWRQIRDHWKGPGTTSDQEYASIIQGAKICLGLVSKANRDLHTTRSAEIPSLGSVLCAERTAEHIHMFREGEEAVFWDSPEECATVCQRLLRDEPLRLSISINGRKRVETSGYLNECVATRILSELGFS